MVEVLPCEPTAFVFDPADYEDVHCIVGIDCMGITIPFSFDPMPAECPDNSLTESYIIMVDGNVMLPSWLEAGYNLPYLTISTADDEHVGTYTVEIQALVSDPASSGKIYITETITFDVIIEANEIVEPPLPPPIPDEPEVVNTAPYFKDWDEDLTIELTEDEREVVFEIE